MKISQKNNESPIDSELWKNFIAKRFKDAFLFSECNYNSREYLKRKYEQKTKD